MAKIGCWTYKIVVKELKLFSKMKSFDMYIIKQYTTINIVNLKTFEMVSTKES